MDLTSERWPRWVARYEKGGVGSPLQVQYTKSGGGGQFASGPLRKVGGGGGGGAIRLRSITKSVGGGGGGQFASGPLRKVGGGGGGQFASGPLQKVGGGGGGNSLQVHYEKWGGGGGGAIRFRSITKSGGGERCKLPHWGLGQSPRSFASRDPPHKRTLTLLGGGGGVRSNPPNPPWLRACLNVCVSNNKKVCCGMCI